MGGGKSDATKYLPLQSRVLDDYCSNTSTCNSYDFIYKLGKTNFKKLTANCCVFTIQSIFRMMVNEYA